MSGFEINLYSNRREFHTFATDDFALLEIGIGSYNISSIANFFKLKEDTFAQIKPMNPDTKEFFSNEDGQTIANKLIGENFLSEMKIMEFDIDTKQYKEVTGFSNILKLNQTKFKPNKFTQPSETKIKDFLQNWNKVQQGFISEQNVVNGYKAIAYKVQNSLSGCITFDADLNILGNSRKSLIRLSLLDSANNSSERSMSFNGSPFISAVPRTAYGAEYSFGGYSQSPTGAYDKPDGTNNPTDAVAGKLATAYDPSTGEHVSGTQQMMARLLDDIDTADIPELSVDELNSLSREDIYDNGPDSPGYMGNFTTGKAIPLSAENGNPHMFGPDFNGGCSADKKVQITVINRLNQSYKAGSVVVVSRMLGESGNWIIVSPGTDAGSKKKISFGNFEYQEHLIPLYRFFTDEKGTIYNPQNYISLLRTKYYKSFIRAKEREYQSIFDGYLEFFPNVSMITKLNILSPRVSYDDENFTTALYSIYVSPESKTFIETAYKEEEASDILSTTDQYIGIGIGDTQFEQVAPNTVLPRNILRKSTKLYKITTPFSSHPEDDPDLGMADVPGFWGILFPEGYKTDQCKKFYDKVKNTVFLGKKIFGVDGDPNLSELTYKATFCVPYLGSNTDSLSFAIDYGDSSVNSILGFLPESIRKTGGIQAYISNFYSAIEDEGFYDACKRYVKQGIYNIYNISNLMENEVYGLEPVNPAKLQFSPLSIEQLYASSTLVNNGFSTIRDSLINFNAQWSTSVDGTTPVVNINLLDYLKLFSVAGTDNAKGDIAADLDNVYPNINMSYKKAFAVTGTYPVLQRHPAPLGTLRNGVGILPPLPPSTSFIRCPIVPVLTCKSTISTNATSLLFTIDQNIGSVPKKTIAGGQGPSVTILPAGPGGVAWSIGGTPLSTNSVPQWGDSTRTDNIDSLGTTALHVRIFEAWPWDQTIFLGNIFTPMHFNPTDKFSYNIENLENGNIKLSEALYDENGEIIVIKSPVDFQLPTDKINGVIPIGSPVTKENLNPMSEWSWSIFRRGAFLSNGGFVYIKPVFGISSMTKANIKNGGSGYKDNTEFTYPDGSSFKVQVDNNGKIIDIHNFQSNYHSDYIMKDDSTGILSLDVTPIQSEIEGNGAVFDPSFILIGKISVDKGPKEVSTIKKLTKSSNNGEDIAEGISTTVVDIDSTSKKFDIFYFFHNDPTHYSLDNNKPYYRDTAQYVISEVKPA